jgi:uncharacterized protein (TIGR02246 family)
MKSILIILIGIFYYYSSLAQNKDVETLKKLNADWITSYVTKDSATMSRIFADDLVLTNPGGTAMSKKEILNNLMSPDQQFLSTKVDTVDVRLFGNIGIINAKITGIIRANDKIITVRTCYMDVYQKREGRWYAVAAHVSLLDPN